MSQRLPLFNLLIQKCQRTSGCPLVVVMRWLLLIEGSHAELLVYERLVLAATWSVSIVRVVAEGWLVQVAKLGHHCIDST